MSKSLNSSTTRNNVRRHHRSYRTPTPLAVTGIMAAAVLVGCSQEQRENWTWNPFEKKSKATAPDAGTKARRPAPPPPPATASNAPNNNAKPTAEDQKAEQVNRDVGNYANSFPQDNSKPKPRESDPRTPAIDDDRPLADATTTPRGAQRTSARPAAQPTAPSPSGPASSDTSEDLVLMPTGSANTPVSSTSGGNSSDVHGGTNNTNVAHSAGQTEPNAIVMTDSSNPQPPANTHSIPSGTEPDEQTEDDNAANGRPPVLGSVQIEGGAESNASTNSDAGTMTPVDDGKNTTITPTPIRPIDTEKPSTPIKPASSEISQPVNTAAAPKNPANEPRPRPVTEEVTPFEDREDVPPAVKPQPVAPQQPIRPEPIKSEPIKQEPNQPAPVKPEPIEPKPQDNAKPATPPALVSSTPAATEASPARQIADMEAIVARQPNNIDQQLKLRMRYLEEGDEARALRPTPGMSEDVQRTVIAQIKSVIAAKSADGRTAPEAANQQLASAEAIRAGAAAKADLLIPKVALCTAIRAFGDYTPYDPPTFPAGASDNKVLVYIEVENFMSRETDDGQFKTVLTLRESLLDARGRELWSMQNPPVEDINRQRRRDFFLITPVRKIPPKLPPGEYFYKVEVEDVQAGKVNSGKTQFKLVTVKN